MNPRRFVLEMNVCIQNYTNMARIDPSQINGLVQERGNSSALAMELRVALTNRNSFNRYALFAILCMHQW